MKSNFIHLINPKNISVIKFKIPKFSKLFLLLFYINYLGLGYFAKAHVPSPSCLISSITAVPTACNSTSNLYNISGIITFNNAPTNGSLTIRVANGQSVQFNAPFTSPLNYTLTGLNSDGAAHTVMASFSYLNVNETCSNSISYNAPVACVAIPACANGQTARSETYSYAVPVNFTDFIDVPVLNIPYFDTQGGTRTLQKAFISLNTHTSQHGIIESKDATPRILRRYFTELLGDLKIGTNTPIITTAGQYEILDGYNFPAGIPVAAAGTFPGDNAAGFTTPAMGSLVNSSMLNMVDPRSTADWVTNATGNASTDDDILYLNPLDLEKTENTVFTTPAELASVTGTGNIDFKVNITTNHQIQGFGNMYTRLNTKADAKVIVTYFYCETAALPVNLLYFNSNQNENSINLTWKTANESNFSHFEVLKSSNATEFGTIGNLKSTGESFYNYTDNQPNEGLNYYQLKMVDLDGSSKLSKVISVNFEKGSSFVSVENPVFNGEFKVFTNLEKPIFTLLNSLGKQINIDSIFDSNNTFRIKSNNNTSGIFYLNILSEGKITTKKVMFP